MLKKIALILILQAAFLKAFGQLEQYYHKIEQVAYHERNPERLFKRIDSIKQTRRPNDSKVTIYFNRDIDFGYRHQRIKITFNGINRYEVNLLIKNDSIHFCSVLYSNLLMDEDAEKLNRKQNHPAIDTTQVSKYLELRNKFYGSLKKINDLIDELNLDKTYAFYCGDGSPKTKDGKYIEIIVQNRNIRKLKDLLTSACCEEQAYGAAGIKMLQKNKQIIPDDIKKLVSFINKRNSELVVCEGCLSGLVKPINIQ
jgi:hypothetical protein